MLIETGVNDLVRKTRLSVASVYKTNEKWCTAFEFLERAPYE
jgi:hypothetical protein